MKINEEKLDPRDRFLRRGWSAQLVAERAGISRQSLTRIEAEEPNVTFANLWQVMRVLGLGEDIDKLAADDEMGQKLQDLDLKTPKRGPRRKVVAKGRFPFMNVKG